MIAENLRKDMPPSDEDSVHLLVAIESRQVRIYRLQLKASLPIGISPHTTARSPLHVHSSLDHGARQSRGPNASYYEAIAEGLADADEITIVGTGEGGKGVTDALLAELRDNHEDLFKRVTGSSMVEGKHLSEDLLLEKAQQSFTSRQLMQDIASL